MFVTLYLSKPTIPAVFLLSLNALMANPESQKQDFRSIHLFIFQAIKLCRDSDTKQHHSTCKINYIIQYTEDFVAFLNSFMITEYPYI